MSRLKYLPLSVFLVLCGCAAIAPTGTDEAGVRPAFSYAVTDNDTPYSQCLASLKEIPVKNLPVFAVGEVADKTGQVNVEENGNAITQGASEMVISALSKTGKALMVERLDLRIPLAEVKLSEQKRLSRSIEDYGKLPASDFILVGAVTELNYNIVSGGAQLFVKGMGGGARTVVVNVALDLRVIDSKTFRIRYVSSLQKQILGYEVEANVFRFFGDTLIELDGGAIRNEPMQLGVRSVIEMAVYQIFTDYLKLPVAPGCSLVENDYMESYLEKQSNINPQEKGVPRDEND